jgi:hypothetical protein
LGSGAHDGGGAGEEREEKRSRAQRSEMGCNMSDRGAHTCSDETAQPKIDTHPPELWGATELLPVFRHFMVKQRKVQARRLAACQKRAQGWNRIEDAHYV